MPRIDPKSRRERIILQGDVPSPLAAARMRVSSALSRQGQAGGVFHRDPEAARAVERQPGRVSRRRVMGIFRHGIALGRARDATAARGPARSPRGSGDRQARAAARPRLEERRPRQRQPGQHRVDAARRDARALPGQERGDQRGAASPRGRARAASIGGKLGEALVALQILTVEQLIEQLGKQARHKLVQALRWPQGAWRFDESYEPIEGMQLRMVEVVLGGLRETAVEDLGRLARLDGMSFELTERGKRLRHELKRVFGERVVIVAREGRRSASSSARSPIARRAGSRSMRC